ncbi:uncharacterized protein LOC121428146 [Lytechinus variegatus]|uniref:uncharacterized protein LOC121428146 n=1 Tax=Lytechinus variegatus TaxID=7654 RepID=UPI001BB1A054|nr:uncharacterized protein LOC121428146 [Lytechinus variegatus]
MASTSSCEEIASDQAGDLSSLILKGKVDEDVLKDYAKHGQIDSPDKEGKTPLMIACLHGLTDTVKSLLAHGADPNSKNVKDGNTPLHYACMVVEPLEEDSLSGSYYSPSKWMTAKLAITVLLVSHEAETVQDNQDGWIPVYVATLYQLIDVVDFLLSKDVALEVKIKATEILGVSQTTLNDHAREGFHSFLQALSFRQEARGLLETSSDISELETCFSKVSLKEFHSQEEMKSVEGSEFAITGHAFLLGERLFPDHLKRKYLYSSLARFASDLMTGVEKMCNEGFEILSYIVGLEQRSELKFGSVAFYLAENSHSIVLEDEEATLEFRQCVRQLLHSYESILHGVPVDTLVDDSKTFIESFGEILFNDAFYCSDVEFLKSLLQVVENSLRVIHDRILKEDPDKYPKVPSVSFKIMELLAEAYVDNVYCGMGSRSLVRVKFVIFKLLFFDNASYKDTSGCTVLHLVAYCVQTARDLDDLMELARVFIRHGCLVDAVNNKGETLRSILEEYEMNDYAIDSEFMELVSTPRTVLRLEELAIRTVLWHHINFRDKIPPSLCEMIEEGVKDSDLERCSDDSEKGSEDDSMAESKDREDESENDDEGDDEDERDVDDEDERDVDDEDERDVDDKDERDVDDEDERDVDDEDERDVDDKDERYVDDEDERYVDDEDERDVDDKDERYVDDEDERYVDDEDERDVDDKDERYVDDEDERYVDDEDERYVDDEDERYVDDEDERDVDDEDESDDDDSEDN